ncbi:MAG TPA: hypothetical protein DCY13_20495 [Verrucomicrobiales bacterium]|nr:hypothetical protein [Verrucomicrobiales bacterium]
MRLIGHLPDEKLARRFADYLLVKDVKSQVEPEGGGQWAVWVHDDDHLEEATAELDQYRSRPDEQKYVAASAEAIQARQKETDELRRHAARQYDRERLNRRSFIDRLGKCTVALMVISLLVTIYTGFGQNEAAFNQFSIAEMEFKDGKIYWSREFLPEVRKGQFWRLFTPMFVHMDFIHILFNLLWLADLASAVERRYGWSRLLLLVLVVSAVSNLTEYIFVSPAFGGMSGVVFALFGFIWTQSKYCRVSGFVVPPLVSGLMIGWFVFCIVGLSGQVANFVHWGGLASGALIGYVSSLLQRNDPLPSSDSEG